VNRREFLALGLGWFPFFWRRKRYVSLAGARFRLISRGHSPRRYLVIHGNEETARQVLEEHMRSNRGVAYAVTSSQRNVPIRSGMLDPNRMFSRPGAEKNLRRLNSGWTPAETGLALDELDRGRDQLVRALFPHDGSRLVALHNNSEGYSVRDEVPISDRVSLKNPDDPHAFFLCTNPKDFELLSESAYNVVLQQKAPPEDDGSLSRLAAARGIRYINLEVGLGKFEKQREMLTYLERTLP
jgi:hypothetical protein